MLLFRNYVAPSKVEGLGVFTAEKIKKGAQVWAFDPTFDRLIPTETYESAPLFLKEQLDRYGYPCPDRPEFIVYEVDAGRFMNHSDTPNTDFSEFGDARSLRDIEAGEEITCNYGDFYKEFELLPNLSENAKK